MGVVPVVEGGGVSIVTLTMSATLTPGTFTSRGGVPQSTATSTVWVPVSVRKVTIARHAAAAAGMIAKLSPARREPTVASATRSFRLLI